LGEGLAAIWEARPPAQRETATDFVTDCHCRSLSARSNERKYSHDIATVADMSNMRHATAQH